MASHSEEKAESPRVEIYTRKYCGYCTRARMLLDEKGISYREYSIDGNAELRYEMIRRADGRTTVPQIFIKGHAIGGCIELFQLQREGRLDALLYSDDTD